MKYNGLSASMAMTAKMTSKRQCGLAYIRRRNGSRESSQRLTTILYCVNGYSLFSKAFNISMTFGGIQYITIKSENT